MPSWKKIKSKTVHKNPWYSVTEDDVIRPDGKSGKYFVINKIPGLIIIPFDGKKMVLVRQYRYMLKKTMWEFPAGRSEGKNLLAEAKRELKEETGVIAKKWTHLKHFAWASGLTNQTGEVYLAERLTQGKIKREGGEADMVVKKFTLLEIETMIDKDEMIDAACIMSLHMFKKHFKI